MKRTAPTVVLLVVLLSPYSVTESARSAEVTVRSVSSILEDVVFHEPRYVRITGDIDKTTTSQVIARAEESNLRSFSLDSGGGDVEAAMELGRYFRRKEANVLVDSCASACLLLLAGSVERFYSIEKFADRTPTHTLGVHRPFSTRSTSTTTEASKEYKRINGLMKEYLEEMSIPASLLDLMNSVEPTSIKWLTYQEAHLYFPLADPTWQDKRYSEEAAKKGISKAEYIRLEQIKNQDGR